MANGEHFLEVAHWQHRKHGQVVPGDVFLSRRIKEEDRVISVLSDGLGSGIKASVLATLTATMAAKFIENYTDVKQTAEVVLDTLPVCSVRKISYSTFTIVDIDTAGHTRVVEHGNPTYVLLRNGRALGVPKQNIKLDRWHDREVFFSEFNAEVGDYLLVFSDGVTQAAIGSRGMPMGWGVENVVRFAGDLVRRKTEVSANELAQALADAALALDDFVPKDDISAAAIYLRQPRRLLLLTGPPFARAKDHELAEQLRTFPGRKVICGGTTANIVGREWGRQVVMALDPYATAEPPISRLAGVDLITEGTLTLGRLADAMEKGFVRERAPRNAVGLLAAELLDSDLIQFVVGTRINEAHQDPDIPMELEIRRHLVARIARVLEQKYLKETHTKYI